MLRPAQRGQQRPPAVDEQHLLTGAPGLVALADRAGDRQRQQHARGQPGHPETPQAGTVGDDELADLDDASQPTPAPSTSTMTSGAVARQISGGCISGGRFGGGGHQLLTPTASAAVAAVVRPQLGAGHPWPEVLPSTRWGRPGPPTVYTQVRPEAVVELVVDTAVEHHRWRHPARFVRLRPDLDADDIVPHVPQDPRAKDVGNERRWSG